MTPDTRVVAAAVHSNQSMSFERHNQPVHQFPDTRQFALSVQPCMHSMRILLQRSCNRAQANVFVHRPYGPHGMLLGVHLVYSEPSPLCQPSPKSPPQTSSLRLSTSSDPASSSHHTCQQEQRPAAHLHGRQQRPAAVLGGVPGRKRRTHDLHVHLRRRGQEAAVL